MTELRTEDVTDTASFLEWCFRYEDGIYVREKIDGKWESVAPSSLDARGKARHIADWLKGGHLPVRVKSEKEMKEDSEALLEKNQLGGK